MEEKDIKDKIVNGARDLFLKYGIRSVSMDDIARQLSVSKKTIYQYFADKDEIVTQVAQQYLQEDRNQFEKMVTGARNALDELIRTSVFLKARVQQLNPALMFDLQKYHSKAWNEWVNYKLSHVRKEVIRNIKQGIAEGIFRADLNPEIIGTMRLEMVQMAFNTDLFPAGSYNLYEVHMQLFEQFVYGLLTEKGRKQYEKCKQEPNNLELIPNHA
jgi:TetR/AcrR family transcriptional regulator, cholesterol catabolism regulator